MKTGAKVVHVGGGRGTIEAVEGAWYGSSACAFVRCTQTAGTWIAGVRYCTPLESIRAA